MSTISVSTPEAQAALARRARGALLGLLAAAAAWLIVKFAWQHAAGYLTFDAARYGRYWSIRYWMLMHVSAGLVALLCGPWQLWSGLRGATGRAHAWRGRLYVTGVLVGTVSALSISLRRPSFPGLGPGLTMLAVAWISTTALAVTAADGCPRAGSFIVAVADEALGSVDFRDGGVDFDFAGDGSTDLSVASCRDAALAQCTAR